MRSEYGLDAGTLERNLPVINNGAECSFAAVRKVFGMNPDWVNDVPYCMRETCDKFVDMRCSITRAKIRFAGSVCCRPAIQETKQKLDRAEDTHAQLLEQNLELVGRRLDKKTALTSAVKVGDSLRCGSCGKEHEVEGLKNPKGIAVKTLLIQTCGEDTRVVGVQGVEMG